MFTTGLRFSRTLIGAFLVAVLSLFLLLAGVSTASAHGGPYELQVTPDGAGGISAAATYTEDGHTVQSIMDPVATATSNDGKEAGPISLISSSEGRGLWVSPEAFLAEGEWTVTVTTTTPEAATASSTFVVAPLAAPVAPEPLAATDNGVSATTSENDSPASMWAWILSGLVVVGAVIAGTATLKRRRAMALAA